MKLHEVVDLRRCSGCAKMEPKREWPCWGVVLHRSMMAGQALDSAVERGRVGMVRVTRVYPYPTYTRSMLRGP
mgnify:CR=1 FL=1